MPHTESYQEELIEELKNPLEATAYLWATFQEEDPEPELLPLALNNVAEALGEKNMPPEEAKIHRAKIDELLTKSGIESIYGLANWLKALGLELSVTVSQEPIATKSTDDSTTSESGYKLTA